MNYLSLKHKQKTISKELAEFLIDNGFKNVYEDLLYNKSGANFFDFSIQDKSKISYLKGDRIPEDINLLFDTDYRKSKGYHTKIGKLLSDDISQKHKQEISALMFGRALKSGVNIFLTKDIKKYYLYNCYCKSFGLSGQLWSSCMRGEEHQESIALYEKFGSDIVELLVITNEEDELLARGLFWKKVNREGKEIQYLDRVYAVNDNISEMLYNYAKKKNILSYRTLSGNLTVDVVIENDDYVPYFDTFKYYSEGLLDNYDGVYLLESTDGAILCDLNQNISFCYNCLESFDIDEGGGYSEHLGDYLCGDCGISTHDGEYHLDSDVVEVNGEYYHREDEDICFSEYHGSYFLIEDCVYSEYYNSYLCADESVCIDDEYYHSDDDCIYFDEEAQEWKLKEETNV